MARYSLTIFLSAFLLFQVQPLIGKIILPWFGGTPAVWNTCMLFFQCLLLLGYAYSHFIVVWCSRKTQAMIHIALLAVAVGMLFYFPPADSLKPTGLDDPIFTILTLLAITIGMPYTMVSSTGPLLQDWFHHTEKQPPFRLYALSNIGSLLALLSYPFLIEPYFVVSNGIFTQTMIWKAGFVVFALGSAWCAIQLMQTPESEPEAESQKELVKEEPIEEKEEIKDKDEEDEEEVAETARVGSKSGKKGKGIKRGGLKGKLKGKGPSMRGEARRIPKRTIAKVARAVPTGPPEPLDYVIWLLLSACGSISLIATTNQLCQDVAVVPFLWILPLTIYLVSMILVFASDDWYSREIFGLWWLIMLASMCYVVHEGVGMDVTYAVGLYLITLFVGCMVCHGELVRLKPNPKYATAFYLMMSAGGALGGVFVNFAAPVLFQGGHWEYHFSLVLTGLLLVAASFRDHDWLSGDEESLFWRKALIGGFGIITLIAGGYLYHLCSLDTDGVVHNERGFYGILKVRDQLDQKGRVFQRSLVNGRILHGFQFMTDDEKRWYPTSYYGHESGVGLAMDHHPARKTPVQLADGKTAPGRGLRFAMVGLGTGSSSGLCQYGDTAKGITPDTMTFYEINPQVREVANNFFKYLSHYAAERGEPLDIKMGDARISMERQLKDLPKGEQFDVLGVDAFSSDAIPVHLLTLESFEIYWKHLKPDGILAIHISNRFLELDPVCVGITKEWNRLHGKGSAEDQEDLQAFEVSTTGNDKVGSYSASWVLITRNQAFMNLPVVRDSITRPWEDYTRTYLWTDDFSNLFDVLRGWTRTGRGR